MTQIWKDDAVWGVTLVQAGPCVVLQVKDKARDGYSALQLGYGSRKEKNIKKPQLGRLKNLAIRPQYLKEFRLETDSTVKVGDVVSVETFAEGDVVTVSGTSKGKGFQGVVKRHGFHGFRKTHGNKDQERAPGSIGPKGPARVFKGTRMGGRMGGDKVTTANLEIIKIDPVNNILFIKGAVPGSINGFVTVQALGELQVNTKVLTTPEVIVQTETILTEEKSEAKEEPEVSQVEDIAKTSVDEVPASQTVTGEASVEVKEEKKEEVN